MSISESTSLASLLRRLAAIPELDPLPRDGEAGDLRAEFFANNWSEARDGLLSRTKKIRVQPQRSDAPHVFRFELDRPYKRRREDGRVELAPGPVCGIICYPPDPFAGAAGHAAVAVLLDAALGFYHPNHSRAFGVMCLGELPGTPALGPLLEHLWGICSYANLTVSDPADAEASAFFSSPGALDGLPPAEPLY